jgi:hypothetical protein
MDIDFSEILKLILQFLSENNLTRSFETLLAETGMTFNLIADAETLQANIHKGNWQTVLQATSHFHYETEAEIVEIQHAIISDLIADEQIEAARFMFQNLVKKHQLNTKFKHKYESLNAMFTAHQHHFLKKTSRSDSSDMFRMKSRQDIARIILSKSEVLEKSLLVEHLTKSLLYTESIQSKAQLPSKVSLLKPLLVPLVDPEDACLDLVAKVVSYKNDKAYPSVIELSPDGMILAVGNSDGLIELLDSIRLDLSSKAMYQREGLHLRHNKYITGLSFDSKGISLASICSDFVLKVWEVGSAKLLKKIQMASSPHSLKVLHFCKEDNCIATFADMVKIWGLNTCKKVAEIQTGFSIPITKAVRISDSDLFAAIDGHSPALKIFDLAKNYLLKTLLLSDPARDISFAGCLVILTDLQLISVTADFASDIVAIKQSHDEIKEAGNLCLSPSGQFVYLLDKQMRRLVSLRLERKKIEFDLLPTRPDELGIPKVTVASSTKNMMCVLTSNHQVVVFANSAYFN